MNIADCVKETTTATSAATITLAGAVAKFQAFAASFDIGATGIPVRVDDLAGNWENGFYTLSDATTLTRTEISSSSNGGAPVIFGAGSKEVSCVMHEGVMARLARTDSTVLSSIGSPSSTLLTVLLNGAFRFAPAQSLLDLVPVSPGGGGSVNPNDVGFDIVLCAGQSNMAGRGSFDAMIDVADPRVWQFAGTSSESNYRTIVSGVDPLYMPEKVETGLVGPASWFGKAYAASIPTNRRVLLVPAAWGGTAMVGGTSPRWAHPSGNLYTNAIDQANRAITAAKLLYPQSRFVGTAWIQGESDGDNGVSQAAYAAEFKDLIAGLRAGITGAADSWFIIGGMVPSAVSSRSGYADIDAAHRQVANETSKCVFVDGPSGYSADNLHYNAAGARIMGSRMGLAVYSALSDTANGGGTTPPIDATAPAFASAQVANGSPSVIQITMSEALAASLPPTSAFAVSGGKSVSSVSISGAVVSVTVNTAYVSGDTITVTYTQPAANPRLQDAAGNVAVSFGPTSVTNNISQAATVPGAPIIGAATASDSSATVTGSAPSSDGGATITEYRATSSPGGISAVSPTLPVTVGGLVNGSAYTFTLAAKNSAGYGPESAASNSVTPAGTPNTYTFEGDTVGAAPANITVSSGTLEVASTGVSAWTGKYARFTGSSTGGAVYRATFSNIPSGGDRIITWKRGASATGQARDAMVLRATAGSAGGVSGARFGYAFQVSGSTGDLRVYKLSSSSAAQLGASFTLPDASSRHFRASAIGSALKFEYSPDGVAWTTAIEVTDGTYTTGEVDYINGFNGSNPATAYIDNVNWS